jgi:hypothetical protein
MRFARPILILMMGVALGAYAFDCVPMTSPEEAMQCCAAMDCASQGHHDQDCCQTAPSMHAPFVKAASMQSVSIAPLVFVPLPVTAELNSMNPARGLTATRYHDPPPLFVPLSILQLRI